MSDSNQQKNHPDPHGFGGGGIEVEHQGHIDCLEDGHLHHKHGDHVDEHVIEVDKTHPDACNHSAKGHPANHVHGPDCGHAAVPHGNHVDYLVEGRLHHPHGDHCDDHGPLKVVS